MNESCSQESVSFDGRNPSASFLMQHDVMTWSSAFSAANGLANANQLGNEICRMDCKRTD
jgi:hypothetical protein